MKSNYRYIVKAFMAMAVIAGTTSCDDFLDREPMSSISPETYYSTAAQLEANLNDEYPNVLPSFGQWTYGIFGEDKGTDNQIEVNANDRYTQDRWKVPHSESDNWKFERIYRINFFLSEALPKFGEDMSGSQNTISGSVATIKHYIGEMYFLRAYEYFKKLQLFGDFPIINQPLAMKEGLERIEKEKTAAVKKFRDAFLTEEGARLKQSVDEAVDCLKEFEDFLWQSIFCGIFIKMR